VSEIVVESDKKRHFSTHTKKKALQVKHLQDYTVPRTGIEPAHCCQYQILSPVTNLFRFNQALSVLTNHLVFN